MPVINPFGVIAGTLSAGTTKATLGELVFSNSNGVSFGIDGQTITASVGAAGGGLTNINVSAGTTSNNLSNVVFSNSNGVSFGLNGSTITASMAGGGGNTGSISAGTTRLTLGEAVFSNSNGLSFGVAGQTITGSYTVPSIAGLLSNINVSAGTTSNNLSDVVFTNANGISFGLNGSTISASVATSLTNVRVSAGTTSNLLSAITLSNSNGISFGLDAGTITASYTVPVVPPVTNSSWTVSDSATSGTVARLAFTNLNGVTLSLSSGAGGSHTIVGSVATSLTAVNVSAGTTSNNLSAITFANSNNVSFGLNGSVVTATATWPIATQVYDVGSAGSTGTVTRYAPEDHVHAGIVRNGVSNVGNTLGNTGASHGQFMFAASGNATASMSTGVGGIHTIWYSVAPQTNQTAGLYAAGNTTGESSSSTFDARTISFVGQGIASVGFSNGSVQISVPAGGGGAGTNTLGISNLGNTSGTSGVISGTALQLVLAGGNNITLSQSINGSSATITISAFTQTVQTQGFSNTLGMSNLGNTAGTSGVISGTGLQYLFAGGANITLSQSINGQSATLSLIGGAGAAGNTGSISAGTTRATLGEVVFSNSNGVSFGVNGQTVTGSIATSLTAVNISAGTTSNLLSAITFNNANGVSFGLNASTITASIATSLTAVNISAGTTSNNLSALTFSNGSNVSFGLNGSVVTASVATSLTGVNVSAGTTSNNLSALTFSNGSNVSFGLNGSVVTASVNTSLTGINISAGTTSNNLSAVTFGNANGLSFGLNASTVTGSYTVPGTLSVFAQSNTTQSSSGTIPFNSLQFQGAGIASVGVSNGSVVISVPAGGGAGFSAGISTQGNTRGTTGFVSNQLLLVGGSNITLSQSVNGQSATLTISGDGPLVNEFNPYDNAAYITGQQGQGSLCFQAMTWPRVAFDRLHLGVFFTNSSNSTGSATLSMWFGIYTKNVATLSLLHSISSTHALTFSGTVGNFSIQGGWRLMSIPWTTTIGGSNYYVGIISSTSSAGANATFSQMLMSNFNASGYSGILGAASTVTAQNPQGQGVYSAATSSLPASVAFSQITGTGTLAFRPPTFHVLSNYL